MIKIPGTEAGVPAIEETIAAGINVNVTPLFSVESYARSRRPTSWPRPPPRGGRVARRALGGELLRLARRHRGGQAARASLGREDLRGIAAVANARAAYMRFKELFRGERFASLLEAGAPVQRPLWASTGVKDPLYPETKYVDALVAPDTVNTMPMADPARLRRGARGHRRHGGPGPGRRSRAAR